MQLPPDVINYLATLQTDGNRVLIPSNTTDALIRAVHPIFQLYGAIAEGKRAWGNARYLFATDPRPLLAIIIETRKANAYNFWPCPPWLATYMAQAAKLADVRRGGYIGDTSAGSGVILDALCAERHRVDRPDLILFAVELSHALCGILREKGYTPVQADSLEWEPPSPPDRYVINPPYSVGEKYGKPGEPPYQPFVYAEHVVRSVETLGAGGLVVALIPQTWRLRSGWGGLMKLKLLIQQHGTYRPVIPGFYLEQGSGVACDVVAIGKDADRRPELPPHEMLGDPYTDALDGSRSVTLHVGGLPPTVDDRALFALFAPFGLIESVSIPSNRTTGRRRGFGFVSLDEEAAHIALTRLDGFRVDGYTLAVRVAH